MIKRNFITECQRERRSPVKALFFMVTKEADVSVLIKEVAAFQRKK